MLRRALLGASVGGGLGTLYGVYGRCARGVCHLEWDATIPAMAGAVLGLCLVLGSRWD